MINAFEEIAKQVNRFRTPFLTKQRVTENTVTLCILWLGREDLNFRPLDPQLSMIPVNYYNLNS